MHLYRRLLAVRQATPALQAGDWRLLEAPPGVLAYDRGGDERRRVAANFADEPVGVPVAGRWTVEVSTSPGREGGEFGGWLDAVEAILLRPIDD